MQEVPLSGLLKPLVSVQQPDEDKAWANSWLARLSVGVSLASLIFVLYTHSPPKGKRVVGFGMYAHKWPSHSIDLCIKKLEFRLL